MMKKFLTLFFAFGFVLYLSTVTSAQSKGVGPSQGRAPEVGRGHDRDQGQDRDVDHNRSHAGTSNDGNQEKNFEERIERNTALKTKVEGMLPAGTNLKTAASGFRNQGQFIAALHVSKNLGIPFDQLKAKMTGSDPMSLGQAIHALKPNMSENGVHKEAEKAELEAKADIKTKPATKPIS